MTTTEAMTVYELGEDGEDWIVSGSGPFDGVAAAEAVRAYCVAAWGETLERNCGEDHVELHAGPYREDWAWKPTNGVYPMDEALLVHGNESAGLSLFAGWRVSVA